MKDKYLKIFIEKLQIKLIPHFRRKFWQKNIMDIEKGIMCSFYIQKER